MYCAYHGVDHPEDTKFTQEHIVPAALGGAERFSIRVCEQANNEFGGRIDGPFVSMFFVAIPRFLYGLAATDGNSPRIDLSGTSVIGSDEVKVRYHLTPEEQFLAIEPKVHKEQQGTDIRYTVGGDPAKVASILRGITEPALSGGKILLNSQREPATMQDILRAAHVIRITPEITRNFSLTINDAYRFFIKLALGTAQLVLGESYTRSTDAEELRKILWAANPNNSQIRGAAWPSADGLENFARIFTKPDSHVLAIFWCPEPVFFVSLFGSFNALIFLTSSATSEGLGDVRDARIYHIGLPSRSVTMSTWSDHLHYLEQNSGPSSGGSH